MKRYNDKDSFVKLSNYLHNNKYNYENFVYKGKNIVGEIICPIHGSFYQTPSIHTRAKRPSGCPECAKSNKKIKFETFIERAKKIHGDNYIYDKNDFYFVKNIIHILYKHLKIMSIKQILLNAHYVLLKMLLLKIEILLMIF